MIGFKIKGGKACAYAKCVACGDEVPTLLDGMVIWSTDVKKEGHWTNVMCYHKDCLPEDFKGKFYIMPLRNYISSLLFNMKEEEGNLAVFAGEALPEGFCLVKPKHVKAAPQVQIWCSHCHKPVEDLNKSLVFYTFENGAVLAKPYFCHDDCYEGAATILADVKFMTLPAMLAQVHNL